jgi:hypothetical protein
MEGVRENELRNEKTYFLDARVLCACGRHCARPGEGAGKFEQQQLHLRKTSNSGSSRFGFPRQRGCARHGNQVSGSHAIQFGD